MIFDGVSAEIAYSDLHTANISTPADPGEHVPGNNVRSVVCDAEGIGAGKWARSVFNSVCDDMINDFEFQFSLARDKSWRFVAQEFSVYLRNL